MPSTHTLACHAPVLDERRAFVRSPARTRLQRHEWGGRHGRAGAVVARKAAARESVRPVARNGAAAAVSAQRSRDSMPTAARRGAAWSVPLPPARPVCTPSECPEDTLAVFVRPLPGRAELTRGELANQHHSPRPAGAVLSPAAQCRTSGAAWHGAMRRVASRRGTLWDSVMRGHMWRGRALWPSLARGASISSSVRLRLVCDGVCASVAGRTHGARLLERPQRAGTRSIAHIKFPTPALRARTEREDGARVREYTHDSVLAVAVPVGVAGTGFLRVLTELSRAAAM